jgi:hypothetical protein
MVYGMYYVYMVMKKLENSYSIKQTLMDLMLCTHGPFNGLSLERSEYRYRIFYHLNCIM